MDKRTIPTWATGEPVVDLARLARLAASAESAVNDLPFWADEAVGDLWQVKHSVKAIASEMRGVAEQAIEASAGRVPTWQEYPGWLGEREETKPIRVGLLAAGGSFIVDGWGCATVPERIAGDASDRDRASVLEIIGECPSEASVWRVESLCEAAMAAKRIEGVRAGPVLRHGELAFDARLLRSWALAPAIIAGDESVRIAAGGHADPLRVFGTGWAAAIMPLRWGDHLRAAQDMADPDA